MGALLQVRLRPGLVPVHAVAPLVGALHQLLQTLHPFGGLLRDGFPYRFDCEPVLHGTHRPVCAPHIRVRPLTPLLSVEFVQRGVQVRDRGAGAYPEEVTGMRCNGGGSQLPQHPVPHRVVRQERNNGSDEEYIHERGAQPHGGGSEPIRRFPGAE